MNEILKKTSKSKTWKESKNYSNGYIDLATQDVSSQTNKLANDLVKNSNEKEFIGKDDF